MYLVKELWTMYNNLVTTLEPTLSIFPPISSISTHVSPIVTTPIQLSSPSISSLPIPSFHMSIPPASFHTSQPLCNIIPFTYPNPSMLVPSVPPRVPSIPANSYALHSVLNVSMSPISSKNSTIISLAQTISSLQWQLSSFTQFKFSVLTMC